MIRVVYAWALLVPAEVPYWITTAEELVFTTVWCTRYPYSLNCRHLSGTSNQTLVWGSDSGCCWPSGPGPWLCSRSSAVLSVSVSASATNTTMP